MSTQYWEEEIEIMSREKLQELQLQRLKKTINIAANLSLIHISEPTRPY